MRCTKKKKKKKIYEHHFKNSYDIHIHSKSSMTNSYVPYLGLLNLGLLK